jgi:hypothetical protein
MSGGTPLCVQSHVLTNFLRQHDIKITSFLEVHWSNRICEGLGILGYETALLGEWFAFGRIILPLSSRISHSKLS